MNKEKDDYLKSYSENMVASKAPKLTSPAILKDPSSAKLDDKAFTPMKIDGTARLSKAV
jgi:hypothetical protein